MELSEVKGNRINQSLYHMHVWTLGWWWV